MMSYQHLASGKTMKLLIKQFPLTISHFPPLWPKYLPCKSVLEHPQSNVRLLVFYRVECLRDKALHHLITMILKWVLFCLQGIFIGYVVVMLTIFRETQRKVQPTLDHHNTKIR